MKSKHFTIIIISIFIAILISCTLYHKKSIPTSLNANSAKIVVTVLESNSLNPITNATVCVIETRKYYQTNTKGLTENIIVPIITNNNFNISLPRNWGEITLLVYKQGYADSINFYTSVTSNTTRVGMVVFLTPIINDGDNIPQINLEPPNPIWSAELIKLYKK